ncbi:helix-turn-helix domain containing protein [Amycolatopsis cynarae]|uniref:Helix-turn-helix domain containing protein n=1 Tax=Amycolatopsis cynarae TaxID=2995223 RepID=A0ABY7B9F5_9PSEU|nr:helix-turn-helix domain containing protein [Amycolatopsis sp. HUAS 11-8]WAL68019.1 helix-turn-helix domain containing protein [Amycolatopsis sp. HUAS 11-8]
MTIIEEHRTTIRASENTYSIEVTALPGGDRTDRLVVSIGGTGPQGEPVAEGQLEISAGAAETFGSLLSETLRHHGALSEPGARRGRPRALRHGRPWTSELDAELERRWLAGETVEEIAAHLERIPGGIRARLPRVGCDPERPGEYLPEPPSRRSPSGPREDP